MGKWRRLLDLLGSEWCGNTGCVPFDKVELEGMEYPPVVYVSEDAFTLWIGTEREWMCHMNRKDSLRVAWFVLWRWRIVGEWCGLRRWLYYKVLHRVTAQHEKEIRALLAKIDGEGGR